MTFVASTPLQAKLLLDLGNSSLLSLVMAGERSAASLAAELSWDVRRVHYKLGRLCEAGLVRVTREEKRAGRAVKHYESVASAFEVPFALSDAATVRDLLAAMYQPFVSGVLDRLATGLEGRDAHVLRLSRDEGGEFSIRPTVTVPDQDAQSFGAWGAYALTPESARELREKLRVLHEEYRARPQEAGARTYLLGLMFTEGDLSG